LDGLALWQAEDVPPYQWHLSRRAEKGGTRPSLVGQDVPSDRSRAIRAEERRTSQVPALQTWWVECSRPGRLVGALDYVGAGLV